MLEESFVQLGKQQKPLRFTRHNLIAEFNHDGILPNTYVTLITPDPVKAHPSQDDRLIGIGIKIYNTMVM